MEDAIRQNTVFNSELITKLNNVKTLADTKGVDHFGITALTNHVADMLNTLPDKINIFNQIREDNEFFVDPYFGSLTGKSDQIANDALTILNGMDNPPTPQQMLDFDNVNILAENIVSDETSAFENAMVTIEIQNYAMELNGLIQDPSGSYVMSFVGGPQVQEALMEEKEKYFARYGFSDVEEPDDGSGGDNTPCCE